MEASSLFPGVREKATAGSSSRKVGKMHALPARLESIAISFQDIVHKSAWGLQGSENTTRAPVWDESGQAIGSRMGQRSL